MGIDVNTLFRHRLEELIGDEQPFAWARRIGLSKGAFSRIWHENTVPKPELLLKISEATGASLDWLLTPHGEPPPEVLGIRELEDQLDRERIRYLEDDFDEKKVQEIERQIEVARERYRQKQQLSAMAATSDTVIGEDLVMVPRYQIEISAGHGAENHREEVLDYMAFRRIWLRDYLGVSPDQAAIVFARGDSMEPVINDGDPVIIDTGHKQLDDGVYVLRLGDHVIMKRLQNRMDGSWVVKSDNSIYDPIILSEEKLAELEVIGRARYTYAGRRL